MRYGQSRVTHQLVTMETEQAAGQHPLDHSTVAWCCSMVPVPWCKAVGHNKANCRAPCVGGVEWLWQQSATFIGLICQPPNALASCPSIPLQRPALRCNTASLHPCSALIHIKTCIFQLLQQVLPFRTYCFLSRYPTLCTAAGLQLDRTAQVPLGC